MGKILGKRVFYEMVFYYFSILVFFWVFSDIGDVESRVFMV